MSEQPTQDLEHLPGDGPLDETDVSLRAYLARLSVVHLREYDPCWPDERVMEWDGNFKADGGLMLVCCERDVDVGEFRRVLEEHLRCRRGPEAMGAGRGRSQEARREDQAADRMPNG
jgi:hypothetical protein